MRGAETRHPRPLCKAGFEFRPGISIVPAPRLRLVAAVMNILSILIGLFASIWMILGIIPFFGWIQWPVAAMCVVGAIFGLLSEKKTGLKINLIVGVVALARLLIGFGVA
jgi:hypothetical protein